MKPFAVFRWDDDRVLDTNRRLTDDETRKGLRGLVYLHETKEDNLNKRVDHSDQTVWFFDTKPEAEGFAEWISSKNPHQDFIVMSSVMLFVSKPGTVSRATISEKGILPV